MPDLSIALALHALAAVFWVGGMAFAWGVLRPVAVNALDGTARQRLWRGVLARFLPLVWVSVIVVLGSGYYLLFAAHGGFIGAGEHVHAMHALGLLMTLLFVYMYYGPWRRFHRAVDGGDTVAGGEHLARIRRIVGVNLVLGLVTVAIGAGGRYWPWV